jgi:hypothetical protein
MDDDFGCLRGVEGNVVQREAHDCCHGVMYATR